MGAEGLNFKTLSRPEFVVGPFGELLTIDDLPSTDIKYWVARRKAELVCAVRGGMCSPHEICSKYGLAPEELASWSEAYDASGIRGLMVTKLPGPRARGKRPDAFGSYGRRA